MAALPPGSMPGASSTLFVGNLPWTTTEDELREYMQGAGTVMSVQMQTHEDTGRSKGWALVEFGSTDIAQYAIQRFHQQDFNGRVLNIRLDRSEIDKLAGVNVFCGNLPWSVKSEELAAIFAAFNPFDVHVKTFQNAKSRGFGIVRFSTEEAAQAAIASLNGFELEGRALEVREDRPRPADAAPRPPRTRAPRPMVVPNGMAAPPLPAEPTNSLYVTNLAWATTSDDLFQHFSTAGAPVSANVQVNEKTGRSKGWALVTYATVELAEQAKNTLHKSDLDGRPISVRFDAKSV